MFIDMFIDILKRKLGLSKKSGVPLERYLSLDNFIFKKVILADKQFFNIFRGFPINTHRFKKEFELLYFMYSAFQSVNYNNFVVTGQIYDNEKYKFYKPAFNKGLEFLKLPQSFNMYSLLKDIGWVGDDLHCLDGAMCRLSEENLMNCSKLIKKFDKVCLADCAYGMFDYVMRFHNDYNEILVGKSIKNVNFNRFYLFS